MAEEENKIILYTTDDGKSQVSLMSRDGRVWLNQKQTWFAEVNAPDWVWLLLQRV